MSASLEDRIRERAYEIWNARGPDARPGRTALACSGAAITVGIGSSTNRSVPHNRAEEACSVRQRRPLTNVRPQPKKAANGG
jgi:hypothetical protein